MQSILMRGRLLCASHLSDLGITIHAKLQTFYSGFRKAFYTGAAVFGNVRFLIFSARESRVEKGKNILKKSQKNSEIQLICGNFCDIILLRGTLRCDMPFLDVIFVPQIFHSNSKADVTPSCETMHDCHVNVTHKAIERICTKPVPEHGGSEQGTVSVGFFADGGKSSDPVFPRTGFGMPNIIRCGDAARAV